MPQHVWCLLPDLWNIALSGRTFANMASVMAGGLLALLKMIHSSLVGREALAQRGPRRRARLALCAGEFCALSGWGQPLAVVGQEAAEESQVTLPVCEHVQGQPFSDTSRRWRRLRACCVGASGGQHSQPVAGVGQSGERRCALAAVEALSRAVANIGR